MLHVRRLSTRNSLLVYMHSAIFLYCVFSQTLWCRVYFKCRHESSYRRGFCGLCKLIFKFMSLNYCHGQFGVPYIQMRTTWLNQHLSFSFFSCVFLLEGMLFLCKP